MDMCVLHALAHYIYTRFVVLCEPFPACSPKDLNKPIFVALNNRGKADITYDGMVKVIKPYMLVVLGNLHKVLHAFRVAGAQHLDHRL